jgi:hypothetical protein
MTKRLIISIALALCAMIFTANAQSSAGGAGSNASGGNLPGAQIAKTISMITGVAISPLLGVSVVGYLDYRDAKTPEQKAKLPWYANPMFFGPAFVLVALCFVKDTAGTALPTVVKKPFDVMETIEHKISGLVATGAFVPIAASIFHAPGGAGNGAALTLSSLGFASIDLSWLYNALTVPVAMAAFFIVFLASNAINILILMSPFTTVDAALKGFRATILASVVASSWANPWIGAAWAVVVILFSWLISGWSFRLSHFGLLFVWEFVTRCRNRFKPDKAGNNVFLGRKMNKVPTRTYGKLIRDDKGNLVLHYRPWLVLPQRVMTLPEGKYAAGRGMFFSEIVQLEGESSRIAILLPPRYRTHEEELVPIYGLVGVRDIGLRAAWAWFKGLFGGGTQAQAAA